MNRNPISTIIVDDEPSARQGLEVLISAEEDFKITAVCKNGIEAIQSILEFRPDLVFLDIQMPGVDGFDVISNLPFSYKPYIVFITAYDEYAVKAFEVHALDYLLKPFTDERFKIMLDQVRKVIYGNRAISESEKMDKLISQLKADRKGEMLLLSDPGDTDGKNIQRKLIIKQAGKVSIIPFDQILYINAYDYYVKIHLATEFILVRIPLKSLSERLPENEFFRIHRSTIVNLRHIREFTSNGKGEYHVVMDSGIELKVSDSYRTQLLKRLK